MKKLFPAVTAVAVLIVAGIVHGIRTDRWGISEKVQQAASRIDRIPQQFGDWVASELERSPSKQAGIARQYFRRYDNKRTGETVSVMLVCGRSGPVCIHTPEVCYGASGYVVGGKTTIKVAHPKGEAVFYTADAVKSKAIEKTSVRIFWAWFVEGKWRVDSKPRIAFAGEPALYKFYVIRDMATPTELKMDPCLDFLRQFLPELNRALGTSTTSTNSEAGDTLVGN